MALAGRLSGFDDSVLDASVLVAAEGRVSSLDNKTIYHTPAPLAQSTVLKKRPRKNDQYEAESFIASLDETPSPVAEPQVARFRLSDLSLQQRSLNQSDPLARVQRVDSLMSNQSGQSNVSGGNTRSSSLGILQLDSIPDTSDGLLNLENSDQDFLHDGSRPVTSSHMTSSSHQMTSSSQQSSLPSSMSSTASTAIYKPSHDSQRERQAANHRPGMGSRDQKLTNHRTGQSSRGSYSSNHRMDDSDSDMDASAPPVQLSGEQLSALDADFSDFDFNDTITDEPLTQSQGRGQDYDQNNLDRLLQGPLDALNNLSINRECDGVSQPTNHSAGFGAFPNQSAAYNGTITNHSAAFNTLPNHQISGFATNQTSNYTNGPLSIQTSGFSANQHPGYASANQSPGFTPANQQAGGSTNQGALDYRYLCKSPSSRVHEDGDGEETNRHARMFTGAVSLFEDSQQSRPSAGPRHLTGMTGMTSETDTDDEIEMALQQMVLMEERQNTPGASEADEDRPGLVGGNSADEAESRGLVTSSRPEDDDWSVRRTGEGEVYQPILGDGGGGGDGESGSDEDRRPRRVFTEERYMADLTPRYHDNRATTPTNDHHGNQRYQGNGSQGQRVQPVGEDDGNDEGYAQIADGRRTSTVTGGVYRGGAPAGPIISQGAPQMARTLEGLVGSQELFMTAPESQRTVPGSAGDMPMVEASQLASRFFNPTSFMGGSSQNSTQELRPSSWGINQSSFDLENALMNDLNHSANHSPASIPPNQQALDAANQNHSNAMTSLPSSNHNLSGGLTLTSELSLGSDLGENTLTPSFMRNYAGEERAGHLADFEFSPLSQPTQPVRHKPPIGNLDRKSPDNYEISPVYSDEHGEYVTDLAFKAPFPPPDAPGAPLGAPAGAPGDAILPASQDYKVDDGDFFSTGEARDMLSQDEKQFKNDNVFHPDDHMGGSCGSNNTSHTSHTSHSGGASASSWSMRSEGQVTRPSWMSDQSDEHLYMRISIGAFMQGRTEALGTLDGDKNFARPDFGGQPITTPPREREPFALIQATPNLSDIIETATDGERSEQNSDREGGTSPARTSRTDQKYPPLDKNDPVRQSLELGSSRRDPLRQSVELGSIARPLDEHRLTIEDLTPDTSTHSGDKSGNINISAINRILTATGADAKPQDLARMFLAGSVKEKNGKDLPSKPTTSPKKSPKKATVSPSKKQPPRATVKTLKLKPPEKSEKSPDSPKSQKSRIPRLVPRTQSQGSEGSPNDVTPVAASQPSLRLTSQPPMVTSSVPVFNLVSAVTNTGTPMADLSNHQMSPLREPITGEEFGHVIPGEAPPRTWNTPRPSSIGCRGEELGSVTSPQTRGYDQGEATSGFHSQATEFLSAQMAEHIPSTPHSGIRRGPRLSSTPMGPPGANGTLEDLPSNIVGGEKSPQRTYSDLDQSLEPRREQALPQIREETRGGSSSQKPYHQNSNQNQNSSFQNDRRYKQYQQDSMEARRIVNHSQQDSGLPDTRRAQYGSRDRSSSQSLPERLQEPAMNLMDMVGRRASTGLTSSHDETEVFTALPPSANDSHMDVDGRRSLMPGAERARPQGRAGPERLLRTAPNLNRLGAQGYESPVVCVQAPGEVSFKDVCCVGTSQTIPIPVRNPSSRWLQCTIRMVTVNIDGLDHEPDQYSPFILRQNLILGPSNAEDVKVSFTPRHAGVYVGHVRISVSPIATDGNHGNGTSNVTSIPTMITVQAIAEVPNIQVLTNGDRLLDFGHLPWGSRDSLPITIQNAGRAPVPIRLTISGTGAYWRCFSFEPFSESSCDLRRSTSRTIVSGRLEGSSDASAGHGQAGQYNVYLKVPDKTYTRANTTPPPELLTALVTVDLDTNTLKSTLCTLNLQSTAGTAKLRTPADTQMISLAAVPSRSDTKLFPLMNAGNIQCRISLEVTEHQHCFQILPNQVLIEPDTEVEVVVKFTPRGETSPQVLESLLKMYIEPDGPAYELDLRGEILTTAPSNQLRLLSNKHCLAWGGLEINTTLSQKIVLRNPLSHKQMFRMLVKGSEHFKIQSLQSGVCPLREKEIYIDAKQDLPVHIQYCPECPGPSQAKLNIYTVGCNSRYSVPLFGYGGTSRVVLEDCQPGQKDHYWTSVGAVVPGETRVVRVAVRNQGAREAYVKILAFSDLDCRCPISGEVLSVQPNEFVLRKQETKVVMLLMKAGERESALCLSKSNIVAALAVLYGDELARHKYRKSVRSGRNKKAPPVGDRRYLKDVNFDVSYLGEELVTEYADYPDTPVDFSLFYSTMSKLVLAVVGEPPNRPAPADTLRQLADRFQGRHDRPASARDSQVSERLPADVRRSVEDAARRVGETTGQRLTSQRSDRDVRMSTDDVIVKDRLSDVRPDRLERSFEKERIPGRNVSDTKLDRDSDRPGTQTTPPVKGTSSFSKPVKCISPIKMTDLSAAGREWDVRPEQIVLQAPSSLEGVSKEVSLTNYTDNPMSFEFTWPAHCITITPEQGTIPPRTSHRISLSGNSTLYSRGIHLPWRGQVFISSGGQTKVLKVQIRDGLSPELSKPSVPPVPQTQERGEVALLDNDINFMETVVGNKKELELVISNTDYQEHKWEISTFSMPYLKDPVSGEMRRTSQSVFTFSRMAGLIGRHERDKVTVTFCPHLVGLHSQYWELHSSSRPDDIKINCSGQSISALSAGLVNGHVTPLTQNQVTRSRSSRSKERHKDRESGAGHGIVVLGESILFPITPVGGAQSQRVTIKNRSPNAQMIRVVAPDSPFKVQHSSLEIRSRHFVRLPIEFHPHKPGKYKANVVLHGDNETLTVQLYAETGP